VQGGKGVRKGLEDEKKYHKTATATDTLSYRVALDSRIDKIIGLFCKRALQKRHYSAKETYYLINPTDRSRPIV